MTAIEFYCGSATISKEFAERGHEVISFDNRRRKGICEPTHKVNILNLKPKHLPKADVIWCSFPCTVFSYAAGDFYFKDGKPQNKEASEMLTLLAHTLFLIEKCLKPRGIYFIENPRGLLRYNKILLDWLCKNNGMTKQLTYSCYGFPSIKPTNFFTNAHNYYPKMGKYGRGNKNPKQDMFNNMTTCQRQKIPGPLAKEIVDYCEKTILGINKSSQGFAKKSTTPLKKSTRIITEIISPFDQRNYNNVRSSLTLF